MAENEAVLGTEIDVDTLDDAQVAELQGKMMNEAETPAPTEPEKAAEPAETAEAAKPEGEEGADTADVDDDADPKTETVPHGRFHREMQRRKQAEQRAQEIERNYSVLTERMTQIMALQQPQQAQPDQQAQPSGPPKGDPVALLEWLAERAVQQEQANVQYAEQNRQQAEHQQLTTRLEQVEQSFRTATPDYDEALSFIAESRDRELQIAYPLSTAEQRQAYIVNEWRGMTAANMEAGRNPAQQIYELAKARGYAKKAPEPPPQAETPSAASQVADREAARLASMSLGAAGGGVANTGQVSPEQLLDMSDAEFEAYKKKHGGSIASAFN